MWFVYDNDEGFCTFPDEERATKYYANRLDYFRRESAKEGEWIPDVTSLCIGKVASVTKLQKMNIESDDDDLEDIRPVFSEAVTTVVW